MKIIHHSNIVHQGLKKITRPLCLPGKLNFLLLGIYFFIGVVQDTALGFALDSFKACPARETLSDVLIGLAGVLIGAGLYHLRVRGLKAKGRALEHHFQEQALQLQEANQKQGQQTTLDSLTGVANQRQFNEVLEQEWKRALRSLAPLTLIMAGIDFFELFKDAYGHQAGDECLKLVAGEFKKIVSRSTDLVARYDEGKFVIILTSTDTNGAETLADKLRAGVDRLKICHVKSLVSDHVTMSIGVATVFPDKGSSPESVLAAADKALNQAIQEGRNRINVKVIINDLL